MHPVEGFRLSPQQKRLWLLHNLEGQQAYNMPKAFVLEDLDVPALQRALAGIVDRHEVLRTAIVLVDGEPRQRILDRVALPLTELDVSADSDPFARASAIVNEEAIRPFDLQAPPCDPAGQDHRASAQDVAAVEVELPRRRVEAEDRPGHEDLGAEPPRLLESAARELVPRHPRREAEVVLDPR